MLKPLNQSRWTSVRESIRDNPGPTFTTSDIDVPSAMEIEDDDVCFDDAAQVTIPDDIILLDANREVRVKLYLGQVHMITSPRIKFGDKILL